MQIDNKQWYWYALFTYLSIIIVTNSAHRHNPSLNMNYLSKPSSFTLYHLLYIWLNFEDMSLKFVGVGGDCQRVLCASLFHSTSFRISTWAFAYIKILSAWFGIITFEVGSHQTVWSFSLVLLNSFDFLTYHSAESITGVSVAGLYNGYWV